MFEQSSCVRQLAGSNGDTREGIEDQRREKARRKTMQVREICGSGGSISRLANAAGAEPVGQMGDEKNHAIVVPSTCPSQNVQKARHSRTTWKLRCRKSLKSA